MSLLYTRVIILRALSLPRSSFIEAAVGTRLISCFLAVKKRFQVFPRCLCCVGRLRLCVRDHVIRDSLEVGDQLHLVTSHRCASAPILVCVSRELMETIKTWAAYYHLRPVLSRCHPQQHPSLPALAATAPSACRRWPVAPSPPAALDAKESTVTVATVVCAARCVA